MSKIIIWKLGVIKKMNMKYVCLMRSLILFLKVNMLFSFRGKNRLGCDWKRT